MEQGRGRWRASGDARVDRDDLVNAAQGCVALAEYAARASAVSHSDNQFRGRRGIVGPPESDLHIMRDRTGDQQHVRKARRGSKMNSEALAVANGIVDRMDLE